MPSGYVTAGGGGICRIHHLLAASLLWLGIFQICFARQSCLMISGDFVKHSLDFHCNFQFRKSKNVLDKSCLSNLQGVLLFGLFILQSFQGNRNFPSNFSTISQFLFLTFPEFCCKTHSSWVLPHWKRLFEMYGHIFAHPVGTRLWHNSVKTSGKYPEAIWFSRDKEKCHFEQLP